MKKVLVALTVIGMIFLCGSVYAEDYFETVRGSLKQISVGDADNIWGVSSGDNIYQWTGSDWTQVRGSLKYISVGSDGSVWGVSSGDNIYRWTGSDWTQVRGSLKQISVGDANNIWGVSSGDNIYQWTGSDWTQVDGSLDHVSVGSYGLISGVDEADTIFIYTPTNNSQDYDVGYSDAKEYCRNNPEACGISTSGGYTQSDLVDAKQEGYNEGYQAGVTNCSTLDSDSCAILENNLDITMPCIDVFGTKMPIKLEKYVNQDDPFWYYWKVVVE